MKKLVTVLSLVVFVALAGCSTVKGVGKDVKKLGGKIENKAETVQQKQQAK
jgi:predicted small secreted protein